jgi:coenzyme PQQ precursor peptide PqqA
MTWVKPKFEIVELCSEVTSYVFHREASNARHVPG